jgi:hypothetical protein
MNSRMKGKQRTIEYDEEEELDLVIPRLNLVGKESGREKNVVSFFGKTFSSSDGSTK